MSLGLVWRDGCAGLPLGHPARRHLRRSICYFWGPETQPGALQLFSAIKIGFFFAYSLFGWDCDGWACSVGMGGEFRDCGAVEVADPPCRPLCRVDVSLVRGSMTRALSSGRVARIAWMFTDGLCASRGWVVCPHLSYFVAMHNRWASLHKPKIRAHNAVLTGLKPCDLGLCRR